MVAIEYTRSGFRLEKKKCIINGRPRSGPRLESFWGPDRTPDQRCTLVLRGLKLGRKQTKFNLAFENLTLVYVSNRPGLRRIRDYGTGNDISIPAPLGSQRVQNSVCAQSTRKIPLNFLQSLFSNWMTQNSKTIVPIIRLKIGYL